MKVSVIVPCYNSEEYLSRCIESILNQTHKDIEVLIVDDGSTDNSRNIAMSFAQKDERVRLFEISHRGVSVARNTGIRNATGEFLAFVDSDDIIKPQMYEELVSVQKEHNVDVVTSDMLIDEEIVKNNMPENRIIDREYILSSVLPSFTYANSIGITAFTNKIIRKDIIENNCIEFYEGFQYQEDLMFMINIYANINSMYYLPKAFYEYVPHAGGLYTSYRRDGGEKFISARKKILFLIDKYKIENIDYTNFNIAFIYNITYYIYRTISRCQGKKECKNIISDILNDNTVIECCKEISQTASSFDRRIAVAIAGGNIKLAVFLICFVHSGKAKKLQSIISKIKG